MLKKINDKTGDSTKFSIKLSEYKKMIAAIPSEYDYSSYEESEPVSYPTSCVQFGSN